MTKKNESDERYDSLYCSQDDYLFLGLCGGLAHKFGMPSGAVRFLFFMGILFSGVSMILYCVGFFLPSLPTKNVKIS